MESLEPLKVLIWAKTYPELSKRNRETVCTGGCLDDGTPIRLYPVPLRYLPGTSQYRLYDWISIPLRRNPLDTRPESFRVARGVIPTTVGRATATHGWEARREILFKPVEPFVARGRLREPQGERQDRIHSLRVTPPALPRLSLNRGKKAGRSTRSRATAVQVRHREEAERPQAARSNRARPFAIWRLTLNDGLPTRVLYE